MTFVWAVIGVCALITLASYLLQARQESLRARASYADAVLDAVLKDDYEVTPCAFQSCRQNCAPTVLLGYYVQPQAVRFTVGCAGTSYTVPFINDKPVVPFQDTVDILKELARNATRI